MTLMWIIVGSLLLIAWVGTILDIVHRHYSGWTAAGYIALVVILPFVGSLIYWFVRKPTRDETEAEYIAQADVRRSAGARPFDSTGTGP